MKFSLKITINIYMSRYMQGRESPPEPTAERATLHTWHMFLVVFLFLLLLHCLQRLNSPYQVDNGLRRSGEIPFVLACVDSERARVALSAAIADAQLVRPHPEA